MFSMEIIVLSVDVQANNERQKKMTQLLNLIIFDKNRYHTFLSHEDNMKKKKHKKPAKQTTEQKAKDVFRKNDEQFHIMYEDIQ